MQAKVYWVTPDGVEHPDAIRADLLRLAGHEVKCITPGLQTQHPDAVYVIRADLMDGIEGLKRTLHAGSRPALIVMRDAAHAALVQRFLDERGDSGSLHDVMAASAAPVELAWRVKRLLRLERRESEQLAQVYYDRLTALLNRRTWQERAEKLARNQVDGEGAIGVLLLDVDHLKQVNDSYGHEAGDEILVFLADCLREWFAPDDLIARFGGGEFVVMLKRQDEKAVTRDARRFIEHFCTIRFPILTGGPQDAHASRLRHREFWRAAVPTAPAQRDVTPLSISGGLALAHASLGLEDLLEAADQALYRAKGDGRGRLVVADELAESLAREGKDLRIDHFENVTRVVTERVTSLITLMGRRLMSEATRDAYHDALTGLHNRRYLDEHVERELEAARRNHRALSLVFLDLDHFHDINMTYGWPTGDAVLRAFAGILERSVRTIDWSARYGGEEFCLVLPDTELQEAVEVAERIRQHTEQLEIVASDGRLVRVTTSIGVVQRGSETTALQLFDRVSALARAAKQRRNCVVAAPDEA
ncbi:GGDEF domain-containing protein [Niveibacterium sp.]|uniref:GGDEF domain-containing protein n=1 Tax=Niveibacterium sp. TaxID=2017444 RepID=UPI0035B4AEDF